MHLHANDENLFHMWYHENAMLYNCLISFLPTQQGQFQGNLISKFSQHSLKSMQLFKVIRDTLLRWHKYYFPHPKGWTKAYSLPPPTGKLSVLSYMTYILSL